MSPKALPLFENEVIERMSIRIVRAGDGLSEALDVSPAPHRRNEEVVFILRGTVSQINHRDVKDIPTRVETVRATSIVEVSEDEVTELFEAHQKRIEEAKVAAQLEAERQAEEEERAAGIHHLPGTEKKASQKQPAGASA